MDDIVVCHAITPDERFYSSVCISEAVSVWNALANCRFDKFEERRQRAITGRSGGRYPFMLTSAPRGLNIKRPSAGAAIVKRKEHRRCH